MDNSRKSSKFYPILTVTNQTTDHRPCLIAPHIAPHFIPKCGTCGTHLMSATLLWHPSIFQFDFTQVFPCVASIHVGPQHTARIRPPASGRPHQAVRIRPSPSYRPAQNCINKGMQHNISSVSTKYSP